MSRTSLISNCRTRAVWDRPATGTRLLPWPLPIPVSLGCPINPLRMTPKTSAPSRPTCPPRPRAADARAYSPRMITHGSYPQRACPTTVDARVLSRMIARSAPLGVVADACGIAPRMISRTATLDAEADACGIAPRMTSRAPTLRAAARAAEGALATLILPHQPRKEPPNLLTNQPKPNPSQPNILSASRDPPTPRLSAAHPPLQTPSPRSDTPASSPGS